jgi:hypothetical protein
MVSGAIGVVFAVLQVAGASVASGDTLRNAERPDTLSVTGAESAVAAPELRAAPPLGIRLPTIILADTVKKKPAPIAYSEWYGRRVTIHKALSWSMLPLFAASYYTGTRLADDGRANSPQWVRRTHPVAAGGAAVLFGANTVTGAWNLWDGRRDREGRTRRLVHSALFIAANAGFVYAGSLGEDAGEDGDVRKKHRTIALGSMGLSTVSWLIMLIGN